MLPISERGSHLPKAISRVTNPGLPGTVKKDKWDGQGTRLKEPLASTTPGRDTFCSLQAVPGPSQALRLSLVIPCTEGASPVRAHP